MHRWMESWSIQPSSQSTIMSQDLSCATFTSGKAMLEQIIPCCCPSAVLENQRTSPGEAYRQRVYTLPSSKSVPRQTDYGSTTGSSSHPGSPPVFVRRHRLFWTPQGEMEGWHRKALWMHLHMLSYKGDPHWDFPWPSPQTPSFKLCGMPVCQQMRSSKRNLQRQCLELSRSRSRSQRSTIELEPRKDSWSPKRARHLPAARHAGVVWERMIRTTRKFMPALVGNCLLDYETLLTATCEAEKTINDHPLTRQRDDPCDFSVSTPNTLLLGYQNACNPPCDVPAIHQPRLNGGSRHRRGLDTFWKRWTRECQPTLQERQRWLHRKPNLVPGDLVLIVDQDRPRGHWPLGLVEETFPDSQGCVRQVVVRTQSETPTTWCKKDLPFREQWCYWREQFSNSELDII